MNSRYEQLAGKLLQGEKFPLLLPPYSFKNIGGLSDENDQRLCAVICSLTTGMNADLWATLSIEQRIGWMREAVATDATAKSVKSKTQKPDASAILPNNLKDIINDRSLSVEEKLCQITRECDELHAWKSPQWAELLGVSSSAIRQTRWWKVDRASWLEKQKDGRATGWPGGIRTH